MQDIFFNVFKFSILLISLNEVYIKLRNMNCQNLSKIQNNQGVSTVGKRIRQARSLTALTREEFGKKHEISPSSLRSWELGISLISEKNLKKLINAFQEEGVFCNEDWVLDKEGSHPLFLAGKKTNLVNRPNSFNAHRETLNAEIEAFITADPQRILLHINSNEHLPYFEPGDIVGGVLIDKEDFEKVDGRLCITNHPHSEQLIVRMLKKSDTRNEYHLICPMSAFYNSEESKSFFSAEITTCAPIIWWRKNK